MFNTTISFKVIVGIILYCSVLPGANAQVELQPWGNLAGIRVDGQLMPFESSLRVVSNNNTVIKSTGKEKQRPKYIRDGNQQIVTTNIDSVYFTEKVEEAGKGMAKITVEAIAKGDVDMDGIFLCLTLPAAFNEKSFIRADKTAGRALNGNSNGLNNYLRSVQKSILLSSPSRQLELTFPDLAALYPTIDSETTSGATHFSIYFQIHKGIFLKNEVVHDTLFIKASGDIDTRPITAVLNTAKTGNAFDGLGGNFRLQNPKGDPQVIDYCIANLRVAWARVEMPWRFWQPVKNSSPADSAKSGRLHPAVQHAMEMAQRLGKMGIPFVLSAWSAPAWAIVGAPKFRPGPDGVWGNPLNQDSMQLIYKSIADYIVYLKDNYGVEASLFSFNESDLGINIRLTGQEHDAFIKGLGAYFVERGLKTKMLLGDNSDATTYPFIYPALNDPAAYPYIGAISFHSWRGWEKETLQKWAEAANKINRPLLVGEGSIDAQAWGYPAIFEEPTYALQEINLYIRLLAICQPLSILQWQLTSDYSPLAGGGIFGNNEALRPTRRFWNLKQLASTPKGLKAMPLITGSSDVTAAAVGDNKKGIYVLHFVNNGTTRKVTVTGLPAKITSLKIFVTGKEKAMREEQSVKVANGKAIFTLETGSFTTLSSQTKF